jgi:hypothetical protein
MLTIIVIHNLANKKFIVIHDNGNQARAIPTSEHINY